MTILLSRALLNQFFRLMDTKDSLKSRMRENRTYGSVEGRRQQCRPSTQQQKKDFITSNTAETDVIQEPKEYQQASYFHSRTGNDIQQPVRTARYGHTRQKTQPKRTAVSRLRMDYNRILCKDLVLLSRP